MTTSSTEQQQQQSSLLFAALCNVVRGHALDLVTYFDPLVVVAVVEHPQSARLSPPPPAAKNPLQTPSISQQSWNFVYLFPLLFTLASFLNGNLLLVYLEEGELSDWRRCSAVPSR
ncbi:hypothetical protein TYRP_023722 [Tyrophagus putrescentiae]|nr:hypothetical protein TYRP_023722 [Tyrophagus putrescentiae]